MRTKFQILFSKRGDYFCLKAREFQKNFYFWYFKAFDCVDHNKLWTILKEMELPDYLTCLLRSLYAGQEAIFRTGHGTKGWLQIGKGVLQGCILSTCLFNLYAEFSSVQFSSVAQSCLTLCNSMNCSMPGLPVHHQLPAFTQTHVHWVGDAIWPYHPLSSPSPPAPKPSQHQSLFQWVNSSHEAAKVLEFQL